MSGGDLTVESENEAVIIGVVGAVAIGGAGGGTGGVTVQGGASIVVNAITNTTTALIDGAVIKGADEVDVSAASDAEIIAAAIGFAGGGSGGGTGGVNISGAGSGAGNGIGNVVTASIRNSDVTAMGSLSVTADDRSDIKAFGGGATGSGSGGGTGGVDVGLAGSFATNVVTNVIDAGIESSNVTADFVLVRADADSDIIVATIGFAANGNGGGTGGVAIAAAGAGSINVITNDVTAEISGGGLVESTAGDVTVRAEDRSSVIATAGAGAISGSGGGVGGVTGQAGASIATNVIINSLTASIDGATVLANGDVVVQAESDAEIIVATIGFAGGGSGGGTIGVQISGAGSASGNAINNDLEALIQGGADVTANGSAIVSAMDSSEIKSFAGGATGFGSGGGVGGINVGFGASFAVNEIGTVVDARIDNSEVTAADVSVAAESEAEIITVTVAFAGGGSGGGVGGVNVAGAGAGSINLIDNAVRAQVLRGSTIAATSGGLSVLAKDRSLIVAAAGAVAFTGGGGGVGAVTVQGGASIAVNTVIVDVVAAIEDSTVDVGTDVSVQADAESEIIVTTVGFAGGGSGGGVGGVNVSGAGSGSGNAIDADVLARITSSHVMAGGDVLVQAGNDSSIFVGSGGAVGSGSGGAVGGVDFGVAGSIAVNVVISDVIAEIDNSTVEAPRVMVDANSTAENVVATVGFAGNGNGGAVGGVPIALAGAGSVIVVTSAVKARIKRNSNVTATAGNISVTASDDSLLAAGAGAGAANGAGGAVGGVTVQGGASYVSNTIVNSIEAAIDESTADAAGDVIVSAESNANLVGAAVGFAAGGSGGAGGGIQIAGAGSAVGNGVENTISATISDSTIVAGSDVIVAAMDRSLVNAGAGALAAGGSGGIAVGVSASVGAAVSLNFVVNTVEAVIENSDVTVAGDVSVLADSEAMVTATTASLSVAVGVAIGSAGIAASGSISSNTIISTITAEIRGGNEHLIDGGGTVLVEATDNSLGVATAGAGALGFGVVGLAVGASVGLNTITNEVSAGVIGASVQAAGNVEVHAASEATIVAASLGAALSTGGSANGSVSTNVVVNTVEARIDSGAVVDAGGSALISATQDYELDAGAGGVAGAIVAAAAAAVSTNSTELTTSAFIGSGRVLADEHVEVVADSDLRLIGAALSGAVSGGASANGSFVIHTTENTTEAYLGAGAVVSADGNIVMTATDQVFMGIGAGGVSAAIPLIPGTGAAVGAANATAVTMNTTRAEIGDGAIANALGNRGGSVIPDGEGGEMTVRGLAVVADSFQDIISVTAGASVGAASSSGSFTEIVLDQTTRARIGQGAEVNLNTAGAHALQSVHVLAGDETRINSGAGGIGGGAVGGGVGADVGVIQKTTEAIIGASAEVAARNDVIVKAFAREEITSVAASAIGGGAGLSTSASSFTLLATTRAVIGFGATVTAADSVQVDATNNTHIDQIVGTIGGSVGSGVGDAAGLSTIEKTTEAFIDSNANVTGAAFGDGVLAKTGEFGTVPTFSDATGISNSFDATNVDPAADTIAIPAHGYVTGDEVILSADGAAIAGLQNGNRYFVIVVNANTIRLSRTRQDAANGIFLDLGSVQTVGTVHRLRSESPQASFPTIAVNAAADSLTIPQHGFVTGDQVTLSDFGFSIAGLENDARYFVIALDENTIRLAASRDDQLAGVFIDIAPTGIAGRLERVLAAPLQVVFFGADVDAAADTITAAGHGLRTGEEIMLSGDGAALGELHNGRHYFAIAVDSNTLKLAASEADAQAGIAIDLDLRNAGPGFADSQFLLDRLS